MEDVHREEQSRAGRLNEIRAPSVEVLGSRRGPEEEDGHQGASRAPAHNWEKTSREMADSAGRRPSAIGHHHQENRVCELREKQDRATDFERLGVEVHIDLTQHKVLLHRVLRWRRGVGIGLWLGYSHWYGSGRPNLRPGHWGWARIATRAPRRELGARAGRRHGA
jgi:hypothetical protein|uniref:Uncharacterized protein n=1 Tax=Zea mays TaxID=4577 RepID=A0A804QAD7_MAIZE